MNRTMTQSRAEEVTRGKVQKLSHKTVWVKSGILYLKFRLVRYFWWTS